MTSKAVKKLVVRAGNIDRARDLVSEAVENLPGRTSLLEFERRIAEEPPPAIDWRELLLPSPLEAAPGEAQGNEKRDIKAPEQ